MQINIRKLQAGGEGQPLEFSVPVDLSSLNMWGEKPFVKPVAVTGQVSERSGILTLHYTAAYLLRLPCARCLADVERQYEHSFTHTLVERVEDTENDMLVTVPDGILHLEELVAADLCLQIDPVTLCDPDCKGLCPHCGADLNRESCGCDGQSPDSSAATALDEE